MNIDGVENGLNRTVTIVTEGLGGISKPAGLTTGQVRAVSAELFRQVKKGMTEQIFTMCEELLDARKWELGVVAYDWAYRLKKRYDENTFRRFESWLERYVRGWGDCDDFCTHAFGELLLQYPEQFERVLAWTEHPYFWVRRAAAVILIPAIKQGKLQPFDPYEVSDRLIQDGHHLVQKGYGWMLKVLSIKEPEGVIAYLERNKERMPRTAFRYALEKLDADSRKRLMQM